MQMNGMKAIAIASAKIPVDTIKTLKKSGTDGIVVVLDGDKEGIKGMVKTIENVLTREKIKCALKKLPDGVDPDEYMRDNGKRALYQLEAYSFSRFWLENTDYEPMEALNKILKIMSKCEVGDLNLHAKEISNYMKSKEHDYKPEDIIKLYKSTVVEERFPNIVDSMQGIEHQLSELRTALKDVMDRIYG